MNCLFCGNKLIDATRRAISISKNCEFSFYRYEFSLHYYVCVNKRIVITNSGWIRIIKSQFFSDGTFILYDPFKHNEFDFNYREFLKGGFVF